MVLGILPVSVEHVTLHIVAVEGIIEVQGLGMPPPPVDSGHVNSCAVLDPHVNDLLPDLHILLGVAVGNQQLCTQFFLLGVVPVVLEYKSFIPGLM